MLWGGKNLELQVRKLGEDYGSKREKRKFVTGNENQGFNSLGVSNSDTSYIKVLVLKVLSQKRCYLFQLVFYGQSLCMADKGGRIMTGNFCKGR